MHLGIIKITYNRTATHFMDDRFVNQGEEVILTLLWQSGASESATVCFVISLSICYWLFKCGVLHVVCVRALVCVWERERERQGHSTSAILTAACLQTHKSFITVSVMRLFLFRAWTDGKTKDIINCLYFYCESWSSWLW